MTQQLQALILLAEDPSSVPSTCTGWLATADRSSFEGPDNLFWYEQAPHSFSCITEADTNTDTDRHRERHTQGQRDTQINTHTNTHI